MLNTLKSKYTKLSVILLSALLLSSGISAVFTDSASTQVQDITTGYGSLELTAGSLVTSVTSSVADLVPGDHITRNVSVHNGASYDLATVALNVTDNQPGQALSSHLEGLRLTVEREDAPGTWTTIYGPNAAPTGNVLPDIGGSVLTANGTTVLRVTQRFIGPDNAKVLKNKKALLTYTFTATQRAAVTPQPSSYSDLILSDNPSYYFKMDSLTGSTVHTDSITGQNYTSPSPITASTPLVVSSTRSMARSSNSGIIGQVSNGIQNSPSFSMEFWINSTLPGTEDIIRLSRSYDLSMLVNGNGRLSLYGSTSLQTPNNVIVTNQTAHVVVTVSTSAVKIYVNGVERASTVGPASIPSTPSASLFLRSRAGNLDEVALYPTALTAAKISAHYTKGITP